MERLSAVLLSLADRIEEIEDLGLFSPDQLAKIVQDAVRAHFESNLDDLVDQIVTSDSYKDYVSDTVEHAVKEMDFEDEIEDQVERYLDRNLDSMVNDCIQNSNLAVDTLVASDAFSDAVAKENKEIIEALEKQRESIVALADAVARAAVPLHRRVWSFLRDKIALLFPKKETVN